MSRRKFLLNAGLAAFTAIMLAGPGAVIFPGTLGWASWVACPRGTAPMTEEYAARHHIDETDGRFWCVAPDGTGHERTMAAMGGLFLMYFMGMSVLFSILSMRPPRAQDDGRSTATSTPRPVPEDVAVKARALVAHDQKIHAIKIVREASGMGLKEAKEWVERLPVTPVAPAPASISSAATVPADAELAARELVAAGHKIQAIKVVRNASAMDLKQAKEWVERLPATTPSTPSPSPALAPPAGIVPADAEAAARELVTAGATIQAIKVVRDATGMGLAEAKYWVESLATRPLSPTAEISAPGSAGDRLAELKRLLDAGLITIEDYERKKSQILAEL